MRKDRKSINIMMIIIVLVSIIGIGANIFLIHNDKEKNKDTSVGSKEMEDKQYVSDVQENTIQAMNNVTPEASIEEGSTKAIIQETEGQKQEQNAQEQNTIEQDIEETSMTQENTTQQNIYYIDGASSVNIRSAANNKSKIVGWLAQGTEVEMLKKDTYYSYIKHGNMEGYVYNEYISQK